MSLHARDERPSASRTRRFFVAWAVLAAIALFPTIALVAIAGASDRLLEGPYEGPVPVTELSACSCARVADVLASLDLGDPDYGFLYRADDATPRETPVDWIQLERALTHGQFRDVTGALEGSSLQVAAADTERSYDLRARFVEYAPSDGSWRV